MNHRQRYRRFLDSLEALRPGSQRLAAPEFVQHEGTDSIFFPSPANRRKLSFWIWIDDENEMSITFGDWHTHASVESETENLADESIVSIARGILDSRFVVAIDGDGKHTGFSTVVWINDHRAVACNGAGGRVGFEINAYRAGPLMRNVPGIKPQTYQSC